jgi:hypothetical protein
MTLREKTFVFRRESPTMQPLGFQQTATSRLAVHGGFSHLGRQTESERIP